jgi:hypothetical protein
LSTNPSALLGLYGSLGSDTFIITPQTVDPVVSKNLRGHRGIIEHEVISSTDEDYDGLVVRGIQADVLDNDGDYGWVLTVDQGGVVRSSRSALTFFICTLVVLTHTISYFLALVND